MQNWRIAQQGKEAELYIYGDIARERWEQADVSAYSLVQQLQELDADALHVHIDSLGGDVSEGWAIYNALRGFKGQVTTYADGFVASAALYPFLAGSRRVASSVSGFFLHSAMVSAWGNAKELRKAADEVEKLNDIGIQAFVDAAGMEEATVRELQQQETWLTPQQAKAYGIATEIATAQQAAYTQSLRQQMMQAMQQAKPPDDKAAQPLQEPAAAAVQQSGAQQTTDTQTGNAPPAQRENMIKKMFS